MMRKSTRRARSKGQALVELTLLTPLLLLIVGGIVECGSAFNTYLQLSNAAREGARNGLLIPTDTATVQNSALNELPSSVASIAVVTIDCAPAGTTAFGSCLSVYSPAHGDLLRVTLSYTYQPLMPPLNGLTSFVALVMETSTTMKTS